MTQVDIVNHIVSEGKGKSKTSVKSIDVNDIDVVSSEEFRKKSLDREKSFSISKKGENLAGLSSKTQNNSGSNNYSNGAGIASKLESKRLQRIYDLFCSYF